MSAKDWSAPPKDVDIVEDDEPQTEEYVPPGSLIPPPPSYTGRFRFMNWHGLRVPISGKVGPYFFSEIENRRTHNQSAIIVVTGAPGDGKSYSAMRLAEILDRKFYVDDNMDLPDDILARFENINIKIRKANDILRLRGEKPLPHQAVRVSQIPFQRERFLFLIGNRSPLEYGQIIIPDEAQYAMGARRWYEDIQKDLMEAIESVRSRGIIIIIVALHLDLLDSIVRKFVLSFMIHMESRGLGTVYRLRTPRFESRMRMYRLGQLRLLLPGYEQCQLADCLRCNHLWDKPIPCQVSRARYERSKKNFTGMMSQIAEEKAAARSRGDTPQRKFSLQEMADYVADRKDRFVFTQKGHIDPMSLVVILSEHPDLTDTPISMSKAGEIRRWLEITKPDISLQQGADK